MATRPRTVPRCSRAASGGLGHRRRVAVRVPGRCRRSAWCSPLNRPRRPDAPGFSSPAEFVVAARQRRCPRAFRSRRGCRPCPTAPLACPRLCHRWWFTPKSKPLGPSATVAFMAILVTGATGNIGRRIVDQLIDLGANDIRALTNNPAKANLPDGVTAITGYLGNPESMPAALAGIDRMYLAPLPATLDVTLEMVADAGVSYVVALSGRAHWQEHADTIAGHRWSTASWGRANSARTSSCGHRRSRQPRTVREPYPDIVQAPISMDDIARVAATLLVNPDQSHHGQMYRTDRTAGPDPRADRRADRCRYRRRPSASSACSTGRGRSSPAPHDGPGANVVSRPSSAPASTHRSAPTTWSSN